MRACSQLSCLPVKLIEMQSRMLSSSLALPVVGPVRCSSSLSRRGVRVAAEKETSDKGDSYSVRCICSPGSDQLVRSQACTQPLAVAENRGARA